MITAELDVVLRPELAVGMETWVPICLTLICYHVGKKRREFTSR